jgi:hypothetical protein
MKGLYEKTSQKGQSETQEEGQTQASQEGKTKNRRSKTCGRQIGQAQGPQGF